jgi:hypothetical protein
LKCTLTIADRLVLSSEGGPPEAEFMMFDAGEIELAATAPGTVREAGYRTTALDAIRRLESSGITMELALDAAGAMIPQLATTYARGAAVRRVAPLLGAAELFEGKSYDAELRRYEGAWIDLPALALDLEIARATTLLQTFHLMALLQEVPESSAVVLDTREYALERRPGERSHKRVSLDNGANIPTALRTLAAHARSIPPGVREQGPTRTALLEALRARAAESSDPQTQERFLAIESASGARDRPGRGPLSDPELWALEEQLSTGNVNGVVERLDAIERQRGRHPATAYLRARASLLTGRESAAAVAERASSLAMSMNAFPELELLAAEAWAKAGQLKRAAPFARDLIDTPGAEEDLRKRALAVLDAAQRAGQLGSIPPPIRAEAKSASVAPARPPRSVQPKPVASRPPLDLALDPPPRAQSPWSDAPEALDDDAVHELPTNPGTLSAPPEARAPSYPSAPAASGSRAVGPPPIPSARIPAAPRTGFGTGFTPPPPAKGVSAPPRGATPVPFGRPEDPSAPPPKRKVSAWPMGQLEDRTPGPRPAPRASSPPAGLNPVRGASQPPFRSDSPAAHVHIPKAPPIPRGPASELAEHLALPPGLTAAQGAADSIPISVIDARIQFTYLARDLGREYRTDRSIDLYADMAGIEAIQARLLERHPNGRIDTHEAALDVRRHGAFLSEVLARTFGAFWVDIAPSDLGYWAMVVPPDTRVWPFGRLVRFIAMAHKERDLVAYYLELAARASR